MSSNEDDVPDVGISASEAGGFNPGRQVEKQFSPVHSALPPTSSGAKFSLGPEQERSFAVTEVMSLSGVESCLDRLRQPSFQVAEEAGRQQTESSATRRLRRSSYEDVAVRRPSRELENVRR